MGRMRIFLFDISAGCRGETCIWVLFKQFIPTAPSAKNQVVPQYCSYFARINISRNFL